MNDQVYQDAKAALEKLAGKVPATWELLVRENVNYAMWSMIIGAVICVIVGIAAALAFRWAWKNSTRDLAEVVAVISGAALLLVTVCFIATVCCNLRMVCAPNVTTMKELLK